MKRYCLALDLKEDPALIREYEDWHRKPPQEVEKSIRAAGITDMEIYRIGQRLFMVMETEDAFRFEKKAAMDAANPHVQAWEDLMWKYQQPLEGSAPGEKWMRMERIFKL
jgi:L-rhamnose mutarotase